MSTGPRGTARRRGPAPLPALHAGPPRFPTAAGDRGAAPTPPRPAPSAAQGRRASRARTPLKPPRRAGRSAYSPVF